jgi:hypothetical protein
VRLVLIDQLALMERRYGCIAMGSFVGIGRGNGLFLEGWDQAGRMGEGWAQWTWDVSQGFGANGRATGSRKCCCGQDGIGRAQWGLWSQWELSRWRRSYP